MSGPEVRHPAHRAAVAVVGLGAVGSVMAAALQEAGASLVLCVRGTRGPVVVDGPGAPATMTVHAPAAGAAAGLEPADWVILAVKSHQTAGAAGWLRALVRGRTRVLVVQNGIEQRSLVAPLVGDATVIPSVVWCPAERVGGVVYQRSRARLVVADDEHGRAVHELLCGERVDVEMTDDFLTAAWRKLILNAVSGLMAVTGCDSGMFRKPAMVELAGRMAEECAAVGRAEGADLPVGSGDAVARTLASRAPGRGSSILADRRSGRPLEWEARNGVVQRLGVVHGIPTPVTDVIVPLLQACSPRAVAQPG